MSQVVLIRPGATLYDEQNRIQGVLDLPLSDRGRAEAVELAEKLAGPPPIELAALYSGPSQNALQTAEVVGRALGLRPKRIDELRNLDQGLWQGLQIDEIRRRHLKIFRQWVDDPFTVCPPQGEDVELAIDRACSALKPLIRRHRDETIALVICEPLAQLIIAQLRGAGRFHLDEPIPTGGFARVTVHPDWGRSNDQT